MLQFRRNGYTTLAIWVPLLTSLWMQVPMALLTFRGKGIPICLPIRSWFTPFVLPWWVPLTIQDTFSQLTSQMAVYFWSCLFIYLTSHHLAPQILTLPKAIRTVPVLHALLIDAHHLVKWPVTLNLREVSQKSQWGTLKFWTFNLKRGHLVSEQILSCRTLCVY